MQILCLLLAFWTSFWVDQMGNDDYYVRERASTVVLVTGYSPTIEERTKDVDAEIAHRAKAVFEFRDGVTRTVDNVVYKAGETGKTIAWYAANNKQTYARYWGTKNFNIWTPFTKITIPVSKQSSDTTLLIRQLLWRYEYEYRDEIENCAEGWKTQRIGFLFLDLETEQPLQTFRPNYCFPE